MSGLPALAAELVWLKVDVIVVPTGQNALAAQQVTRTIPIVAASLGGDPARSGLVASFARPGGNITGLSFAGPELEGKQIQLLKEIAPSVSRVAVLANPTNGSHSAWLRDANVTARTLRVQPQALEAREPGEFESVFAAITRERAGAFSSWQTGCFFSTEQNSPRSQQSAESRRCTG